ncbi:MAG: sensor histidine kinase [Synechococcus sp.]
MVPASGPNGTLWLRTRWFLALITALVMAADLASSSHVVLSYFYFIPVLLVVERLSRPAALGFCGLCCLLTLSTVLQAEPPSSLWLPHLASRLLVCLALFVTTELGLRNRRLRGIQLALEVRLAQADLRQGLIATLAHDLKTPVLGSLASARMMLQELDPADASLQRRGLAAILSSQNRCLRLIEDLLQVFRADLEGLPLHLVPLDLLPLAEQTLEDLRPLAQEREIRLELEGSEGLRGRAWVGDAALLRRLIENLLLNAIDHSLRRQQVDLRLEARDQELRLQVLDRGSGFPDHALPHLFERFYRADPDRRGSGLGLYLCRQIAEAHGGTLTAANRPGGGASFLVRLPQVVPSWSSRMPPTLAASADRG